MSFLNKKERVIEIQMTQLGKHLLSEGRFQPEFYEFYDNEIIYDNQYVGEAESQNEAAQRIKDAVQNEVQYVYHGIETEVSQINKLARAGLVSLGDEKIQPTNEKHYSLYSSLGNSSLGERRAPSWDIRCLHGSLTGSISYITGSHQTIRIPQLENILEYNISIGETEPNLDNNEMDDILNPMPIDVGIDKIYEDGTFIDVTDDYLLVEISEKNVPFLNENFDIEIFRIEDGNKSGTPGNIQNKLIPLSFLYRKDKKNMIDDGDGIEIDPGLLEVDSSFVEYFLEVQVDSEIDRQEICDTFEDTSNDIFADRSFDCPPGGSSKKRNIYKDFSSIDEEDCD